MAKVQVINFSSVSQRIEFINDKGDHDSHPINSKNYVNVDDEAIITSKEDLIKRGLRIVPEKLATTSPVVANANAKSTTNEKNTTEKPSETKE